MNYDMIDISSVKKATYNPRKIDKDELEKLKLSLKEFGCVRPLIINSTTGNLISGHQMLDAAKELGWKQLPYIKTEVSVEKEKALNLVMNKVQGDWDYGLLTDMLQELNQSNMLDLSGFSSLDLEMIKGFEDNGAVIVDDLVLDPMKTGQSFELSFKFDNEIEYKKVRAFFDNTSLKWKNKKELNTNLLSKLVEEKNEKSE